MMTFYQYSASILNTQKENKIENLPINVAGRINKFLANLNLLILILPGFEPPLTKPIIFGARTTLPIIEGEYSALAEGGGHNILSKSHFWRSKIQLPLSPQLTVLLTFLLAEFESSSYHGVSSQTIQE